MSKMESAYIIETYLRYINNKEFPCIAAKAAVAQQKICCIVVGNMNCPKDDKDILNFLYAFVDNYRTAKDTYHSAAVIFQSPQNFTEEVFDKLLWQRLQSLADLDARNYAYDNRVSADPSLPDFSFSLKEEAFYIIGLHANSSRPSRRFDFPVLVFNPHAQFEFLKKQMKYELMKNVVRKRDIIYSGSINPMLNDFGESSEASQYSGRKYDASWQCPLNIHHEPTQRNPTA